MYCSQCGTEYGEGVSECSGCGMRLRDPDLVIVLETSDRIQLALAKGLLEDAGIPFFVLGQIATLVQDVDGFVHKWVHVQVPREREAEARQILELLLEPETIL